MSALIPPKHDLRGGKISADSFAMSSNTFVVSSMRCFFAARGQPGGEPRNSLSPYMSLVLPPVH